MSGTRGGSGGGGSRAAARGAAPTIIAERAGPCRPPAHPLQIRGVAWENPPATVADGRRSSPVAGFLGVVGGDGWDMTTGPRRPRAAPRVLIVSDHASARFGGEAILPLHVFRRLRRRGVDAWLLVHDRTRDELLALMPEEEGRIVFLPDGPLNRACSRLSRHLPSQLAHVTFGFVSRLSTQLAARRRARRLVAELGIDLVHQPIPVSPREPSTLYGLGAPVVIGPMNGNMAFPPPSSPATSGWPACSTTWPGGPRRACTT